MKSPIILQSLALSVAILMGTSAVSPSVASPRASHGSAAEHRQAPKEEPTRVVISGKTLVPQTPGATPIIESGTFNTPAGVVNVCVTPKGNERQVTFSSITGGDFDFIGYHVRLAAGGSCTCSLSNQGYDDFSIVWDKAIVRCGDSYDANAGKQYFGINVPVTALHSSTAAESVPSPTPAADRSPMPMMPKILPAPKANAELPLLPPPPSGFPVVPAVNPTPSTSGTLPASIVNPEFPDQHLTSAPAGTAMLTPATPVVNGTKPTTAIRPIPSSPHKKAGFLSAEEMAIKLAASYNGRLSARKAAEIALEKASVVGAAPAASVPKGAEKLDPKADYLTKGDTVHLSIASVGFDKTVTVNDSGTIPVTLRPDESALVVQGKTIGQLIRTLSSQLKEAGIHNPQVVISATR